MSYKLKSNQDYGFPNPLQKAAMLPIIANRAPTTNDKLPIGQRWIWKNTGTYENIGYTATGLANWTPTIGAFTSLSADPGPIIEYDTTAAATSPSFIMRKSLGTTVTPVIATNPTGTVSFQGLSAAATWLANAAINVTVPVGATIAGNRLAGAMTFQTRSDVAAAALATRMTIASTGCITIANPDAGVALTITAGGLTVTAGDITAAAGNIAATLGSVSANTTVTAGTGVTATTGGVTASAGDITATTGRIIASADNIIVKDATAGATANDILFRKSRAADAIIITGDVLGNIDFQGSDGVQFLTSSSIVCTSSGVIGVGQIPSGMVFSTTPTAAGGAPLARMTIGSDGLVSAENSAADATGASLAVRKSRAAGAIVVQGDLLGTISFQGVGAVGTSQIAACITSTILNPSTIAATRVAGDLKFYTHPDAAAANPTLRLTIDTTGLFTIAAPDGAGAALTITAGGLTVTAGGLLVTAGGGHIVAGGLLVDAGTTTIAGATNINVTGAEATIIATGGTGTLALGNATGNTIVTGTLNTTGALSSTTTVTAGTNLVATAGSVSAATTVTAGTNLVATAGSVTAGTSITATLGDITATHGDVVIGTDTHRLILPAGATPISIVSGTGDPNGAVTAFRGSLFLRTDGNGAAERLWVNTNAAGGTTWVSITTAS